MCTPPTGVTVSVFSDLPLSLCIWISAAVAITYTVLGGLYSVAFTDVIQLSLVFCSLVSFHTHTKKNTNKAAFPTLCTYMFRFHCAIFSVYSGCVPRLFWQAMFILTSLKQHSTTHIRPPGLAALSLTMCGDGLIIS